MATPTNFQKVREFNRAFDVMPKSWEITPRPNIFEEDPNAVILRLALIREEIGEFQDAFKNFDIIEMRDAIAVILYVIYGMADVFGIDIDQLVIEFCGKSANSNFHMINKHSNLIMYPLDTLITYISQVFSSLESHCSERNFEKVAKNLRFLLESVYVLANILEIDADADFAIVHESNMSKLCSSESDAIATVADYEAKFANGTSPYDSPYYYSIPELNKWCIKNRSSGKVLKNINYIKVKFEA